MKKSFLLKNVSKAASVFLAAFLTFSFVSCGDAKFSDDTDFTADEMEMISSLAERSTWSVQGSTFSHDPSVIYADGLYWQFYTADGIGVKYSSDGVKWNDGVRVFASAPSWWKQYVPAKTDFNIWAPNITYYNGKYNLYYSVSSFGSRTSCIGLMQCTSILKGDWKDCGMVINSTQSSAYNCIDPQLITTGTPYLVFGSWSTGIYVVRLSSGTMKPNASPVKIAYRGGGIEGPCIWNRGNGYYYLFASYGKCCDGVNSTYSIRYGRSKSITGPYLDKNGVDMVNGGGTVLLSSSGRQIGPGGQDIFTDKNGNTALVYHYYDSYNNGTATLGIKNMKTVNGWPVLY